MEFVQKLRPEHLQSFWYSASKYNFALVGTFISLLWMTAPDKEEAQTYRTRLDEYRWMLRLSSKSADFLERALGMLATSTGVLVKAIPEKPDPERILSRYQRRARNNSSSVDMNQPEHISRVPSVAYQSESELHEDTSPENFLGETPSESGIVGSDWNVDHAWFNALGEASGTFGSLEGASLSNAYVGSEETHGLDFREQY